MFDDAGIGSTGTDSLASTATNISPAMASAYTVEPPNKGHFGNGPLVLCSEVVPISEVHDFSTHFDCNILNKLVNALKCIIRVVEMIIKWLVCSVSVST